MKKKRLPNITNFENILMSNQIKPYCSVNIEAALVGQKLKIELQEDIKDACECFIVAFDKKEQKCLAIQKMTDIRKKSVKVSFASEFINVMSAFEKIKYARLCMAVVWKEKYSFFYLSKDISKKEYREQDYYIGNVAGWTYEKKSMGIVIYYSAAGLLSMKPMEMLLYPKKYIENMLLDQGIGEKDIWQFGIEDGKLLISYGFGENRNSFCEEILLSDLELGKRITISMSVPEKDKNRVLWIGKMEKDKGEEVICCYTNNQDEELYVMLFSEMEQVYKRFLRFKCDNAKVWISRKKLHVRFFWHIYTEKKQDIVVDKVELVIDANHHYPLQFEISDNEQILHVKRDVDISSIIEKETAINNSIHIAVWVDGICCQYNIGNKTRKESETKYYYVPSSRIYIDDWAVFIRQNMHQNYVMVVRKKEPEESAFWFWIFENLFVSLFFYHLGIFAKKYRKKKVNLFYEKNSMKAEEGTFELFQRVLEEKNSKNYYILDNRSEQWAVLGGRKNIVRRYSLKYYWLLYSANYLISTEMSSHLNVHRSTNYYIRKALLDCPLFFLQHGITYLKCQGKSSVFGKGKEGEPTFIVVGSEKEKQVVCEMLEIESEQCVKAGLPIFDTIRYEHINQLSEDIVTIMLTWKAEDEHLLTHFEDSLYYKNTKYIYDLMQQLLPKEQIRIEPHPKVRSLLQKTDLKECIWSGTMAEVLQSTKLLITDYSSVCYNVFYQGSGVVFYQPDIQDYERLNGELIPNSDEYIGLRTSQMNELKEILQKGISEQKINLNYFRNEEFKIRYKQINEFHDGKNIERIFRFLQEKNII